MKKSTILIIFVLAAMILGVVASASASPYSDGVVAIDKIRFALDNKNNDLANEGLAELRVAVYACMRELAAKGEYNPRLNDVITYAYQATSGASNWNELLDMAKAILLDTMKPMETDSSHS